jgi:hypothetical protein
MMGLLIGTTVPTPSLRAQEVRDASGEAHDFGRVVAGVDRYVDAFSRGDSSVPILVLPDSSYRKALALELPTLPPPVAVHYSPRYGDRAAALQHAIVDLRGAGTRAGELVDPIFARPIDHVAELAPWGEIYDGLLFLRSVRPVSCDEDE